MDGLPIHHLSFHEATKIPAVIYASTLLAGSAVPIFNASATTSMYLSPEPVLKITTLSVGFRKPSRSNRWYAGRQAAPSGEANSPSWLAHSFTPRKMSSSETDTA